ncbi:MAG: hypothetical protein MZU91_00300 [Desulfosudis oleivorans]|nr:hypothetical protein [Desulfosudis oleivorans]
MRRSGPTETGIADEDIDLSECRKVSAAMAPTCSSSLTSVGTTSAFLPLARTSEATFQALPCGERIRRHDIPRRRRPRPVLS